MTIEEFKKETTTIKCEYCKREKEIPLMDYMRDYNPKELDGPKFCSKRCEAHHYAKKIQELETHFKF